MQVLSPEGSFVFLLESTKPAEGLDMGSVHVKYMFTNSRDNASLARIGACAVLCAAWMYCMWLCLAAPVSVGMRAAVGWMRRDACAVFCWVLQAFAADGKIKAVFSKGRIFQFTQEDVNDLFAEACREGDGRTLGSEINCCVGIIVHSLALCGGTGIVLTRRH